jgi:hypothetical protein
MADLDRSLSDVDSYAESDNEEVYNGNDSTTTESDRLSGSDTNPDSLLSKTDSVADSIAKKDTKAACHLRVIVMALFIFMSVLVPIVIFTSAREIEQEGFQSEFDALATQVIDSFEFNVARKLGAIDSLGISFTSYAVETNSTPPNVTMPDFDLRAANTLALADTFSVFFVPLVEEDTRQEWEQYSDENQGWISTALTRKTATSLRKLEEVKGISETIYKFGESGQKVSEEYGSGPYFPVWQNAPVFEDIVNFNLLSVDTLRDGIFAMRESKEAVLGKVVEFSKNEVIIQDYFDDFLTRGAQNRGEPVSNLFYPVFNQFGSDAELVALFSMVIFWHKLFEGVSLSWLSCFSLNAGKQLTCTSHVSFNIDPAIQRKRNYLRDPKCVWARLHVSN